ncbi:S46 family peptidase [Sphingobacteriales bacterium CHB3]|nr:S46 family peptidase [Sphingobacteriales bacterium CHB3]
MSFLTRTARFVLRSRSIAVDIRYVLRVTEKFAGAHHLLHEMGASVSN